MTIKADSPEEYLAQLPEDRREALTTVREAILKVLPKGYEETMQYNMITYVVPHSIFPDGYHCNPKDALMFASIGNQKNHMAVYLMSVYGDGPVKEKFIADYEKSGKKLDMGACCVRFKKLENLALDAVCDAISSVPVDKYLADYVSIRDSAKSAKKKK